MTEVKNPNTSGHLISSLPYENVIRKICGPNWRDQSQADIDGALGIAIVKSIADGVPANASEIADHLGVKKDILLSAYTSLVVAGVIKMDGLPMDEEEIRNNDERVLCYYHGYAAQYTFVSR